MIDLSTRTTVVKGDKTYRFCFMTSNLDPKRFQIGFTLYCLSICVISEHRCGSFWLGNNILDLGLSSLKFDLKT